MLSEDNVLHKRRRLKSATLEMKGKKEINDFVSEESDREYVKEEVKDEIVAEDADEEYLAAKNKDEGIVKQTDGDLDAEVDADIDAENPNAAENLSVADLVD